jgi:hypothetical protein
MALSAKQNRSLWTMDEIQKPSDCERCTIVRTLYILQVESDLILILNLLLQLLYNYILKYIPLWANYRPPLWSSGDIPWLQTQRSRVR